jgi:predicted nucleic acid-binding protein
VTSYLLDTDIAIELLRGRNVRVAGSLASKHRQQIFLSTVTVAELLFGALRSQEPEKSVAFMPAVLLIRFSLRSWTTWPPNDPAPSERISKDGASESALMTC